MAGLVLRRLLLAQEPAYAGRKDTIITLLFSDVVTGDPSKPHYFVPMTVEDLRLRYLFALSRYRPDSKEQSFVGDYPKRYQPHHNSSCPKSNQYWLMLLKGFDQGARLVECNRPDCVADDA